VQRADLVAIIQPRMEEVFSLVLQEIERVGALNYLPAGIVLTGGGSRLPGVRRLAADILNMPVRVAGPGELRGLVDQLSSPAYATSVGLLLWLQHVAVSEGPAAPAPKRRGRGERPSVDWGQIKDFLKRLAP
jgi:cell division protein FtsA